jgi:hypothetical protein
MTNIAPRVPLMEIPPAAGELLLPDPNPTTLLQRTKHGFERLLRGRNARLEAEVRAGTVSPTGREKSMSRPAERPMLNPGRSGRRDVIDRRFSGTSVQFGVVGHFLTLREAA